MEQQINDIKIYNERMSLSIADKLFFLKELDPNGFDTVVDFGCANGQLLKMIPDKYIRIGIDNSDVMINEAKKNFPEGIFLSSLEEAKTFDLSSAVLNMSSVIHEVYSYSSIKEIQKFWKDVFYSGYKYITIRDMMISKNTNRKATKKELAIINENLKYKELFDDFQKSYPERRLRDILHFLLKYRYIENWNREKGENYFPLTVEELLDLIPNNYELILCNVYIPKWIYFKVFDDFNYKIKNNTHINLVLKKVQL